MLEEDTRKHSLIPLILVIITGIASIFFYPGESYVPATMLVIAFAQNISFSLVSNARNRNNENYIIVASLFSNGVWFITFAFLVYREVSPELFLPFLVGTTLGSLYGKSLSKKQEEKLKLTANATKSKLQKSANTVFLKTAGAFCLMLALFYAYLEGQFMLVLPLVGMTYVQNLGFSLGSRAKNRGSYNYLILTNIFSVVVWFVTFRYLITNNMSFVLFVPYTISAIFGGLTGVKLAIRIERFFGFDPDEKKEVSLEWVSFGTFVKNWWLLALVVICCLSFMFIHSSPFAERLGFAQTDLTMDMLLVGMLVFIAESVFYTIASRAGTRDHFNYHLYARLSNGSVWFMTYGFILIYGASFEFLVPIIAGKTIGGIFGQKIGMYIENKVGARMDKKKSAKA